MKQYDTIIDYLIGSTYHDSEELPKKIVTITGQGSEAGGDPIGVVLRICRNSLEKYFTGSKFTLHVLSDKLLVN